MKAAPSLGRNLYSALDRYEREVRAVLGKDWSMARAHALTKFTANSIAQKELRKLTGIDRSSLSAMVAAMIKDGLVWAIRSEDDRRVIILRLTRAGMDARTKAMAALRAADARLMAAIPSGNRNLVLEQLARVARHPETK